MPSPHAQIPRKIVVLGDSQALPRGKAWGNVDVELTYPWQLQARLKERFGLDAPVVIERGMRSRTIEDVLLEWEEQVTLKKPDVVVLNVGGADCTPRVLGRRHKKFWERFPVAAVRNRVLDLEYRYRRRILSSIEGRPYVPLARFKRHLAEIVRLSEASGVRQVLLMNLLPISDKLEYFWPGLAKNTEDYNRAIAEMDGVGPVRVFDFHGLVTSWGGPDRTTLDSMHLRPEAHRLLAAELERAILEPRALGLSPAEFLQRSPEHEHRNVEP
jgi:lysophospholipase L1-like esterase